jgi:predicted metal-binding membrane protein
MATMLITGVTSLAVMIALAVLTLLEQVAAPGHRVRAAVGVVLIVTGLASLIL